MKIIVDIDTEDDNVISTDEIIVAIDRALEKFVLLSRHEGVRGIKDYTVRQVVDVEEQIASDHRQGGGL